MILTKDRGFYRSLLLLSLPIALQNLITFAVGFADGLKFFFLHAGSHPFLRLSRYARIPRS